MSLRRRVGVATGAGAVLLTLLLVGCRALDQPPDEKPTAREIPAPTLTLRRSLLPPSASAAPSGASAAPIPSSGGPPGPACCDALRAAVVDAAIEEESALLFAALECDKMAAAKKVDPTKLRALLAGIQLPPACR